ncbi:MAG TPA: hypothetical protein VMB51_09490 [Solirubrobacteraceae bacterium]|nr:hypothetical protein [Solirubrobacteraceae bacterium]
MNQNDAGAAPAAVPSPGEKLEQAELVILQKMLNDQTPGLWTLEEIRRMMGHEGDIDALVRCLDEAGLVHRLDRFVFPSRAAGRALELAELT